MRCYNMDCDQNSWGFCQCEKIDNMVDINKIRQGVANLVILNTEGQERRLGYNEALKDVVDILIKITEGSVDD